MTVKLNDAALADHTHLSSISGCQQHQDSL